MVPPSSSTSTALSSSSTVLTETSTPNNGRDGSTLTPTSNTSAASSCIAIHHNNGESNNSRSNGNHPGNPGKQVHNPSTETKITIGNGANSNNTLNTVKAVNGPAVIAAAPNITVAHNSSNANVKDREERYAAAQAAIAMANGGGNSIQSNGSNISNNSHAPATAMSGHNHGPSLFVSVPLSNANVPGINIPVTHSAVSAATGNFHQLLDISYLFFKYK